MTFVRIFYFKLPNFKVQLQTVNGILGKIYPARPKALVFLAICKKRNLRCVGSTSTEYKQVHFRNHLSMLSNGKTCELAVHFNSSEHRFHK